MLDVHPSHVTVFSNTLLSDISRNCAATGLIPAAGYGKLANPCPNEPEQHRIARSLEADHSFLDSMSKGNHQ